MQTCIDRLVMGGQVDSQIDANKKQVLAERFQRNLVLAHAKENNAETDLHWLAKQ